MRVVLSIFAALATLSAHAADAQDAATTESATEAPEEVVVRGKRLVDFRVAVETARMRAYDIFNEINSTNDFDVHCKDEIRHFSRAKQRVCRARFEERISEQAGKDYFDSLLLRCRADNGVTQICMFSGVGQTAADRAQTDESQKPGLHARMNEEILKLAGENPQFAQAILDFYKVSQEYDAARKGRDDD